MTTPEHDGDELDHLISEMEAHLAQLETQLTRLKARRDTERTAANDQQAEADAQRRRRAFYIVPGLAALVPLGRRILTHPAGAAVAASAATAAVTVAATLALTPHERPDPPTSQRPDVTALPPAGHNPPRIGPPRGSPPQALDTPQPQRSGEHPEDPSGTPIPSATPGEASPTITSTIEGPAPDRSCRILFPRLPVLRRGLLCGPM